MPKHSGWLGGGGVVGCHFILKKGETDIYINFGMGGGTKNQSASEGKILWGTRH